MQTPRPKNSAAVSRQSVEAARKSREEVFQMLETDAKGLTQAQVEERLAEYGPNEVASEQRQSWWWRLYVAARNPLVILLTVLAVLSFATGDFRAGSVMLLMVGLGLSLRFVQETRADNAAAKLKAMINVTATVVRDGQTA